MRCATPFNTTAPQVPSFGNTLAALVFRDDNPLDLSAAYSIIAAHELKSCAKGSFHRDIIRSAEHLRSFIPVPFLKNGQNLLF